MYSFDSNTTCYWLNQMVWLIRSFIPFIFRKRFKVFLRMLVHPNYMKKTYEKYSQMKESSVRQSKQSHTYLLVLYLTEGDVFQNLSVFRKIYRGLTLSGPGDFFTCSKLHVPKMVKKQALNKMGSVYDFALSPPPRYI